MYPLHLNYTTTLPCRTITMKITIFYHSACIGIKWKFDISDCHSLLTVQNPAKTVYFKTCSKCLFPAFTQARSLLTKLSIALLTEFCGRSSDIVCKTFFSSSMVFGLGWNVSFKHSSPDMVIKRIEVWWVRWPFVISIRALPNIPVKNCNFHCNCFTR